MEQLVIDQTRLDGTVVLEPVGEVDLATAGQLTAQLLTTVDTADRVVVRMDQLSFLDSTGINAVVAGFKEATDHGVVFCLAAPASIVAKALQITGVDQAIPTYPSVEAALEDTPELPSST